MIVVEVCPSAHGPFIRTYILICQVQFIGKDRQSVANALIKRLRRTDSGDRVAGALILRSKFRDFGYENPISANGNSGQNALLAGKSSKRESMAQKDRRQLTYPAQPSHRPSFLMEKIH
jgi:hypothetical protein